MELSELFDRVPAFARLEGIARGLMPRQLVQLLVQGDRLTLSWLKDGERQWRSEVLPPDLIRDGLPMQRQALGELCADLLLDCGLSPLAVDLDVLLPLEACHWRLLDPQADGYVQLADLRAQSLALDWPFSIDDAYLALMPLANATQLHVGGWRSAPDAPGLGGCGGGSRSELASGGLGVGRGVAGAFEFV